MYVCVIVQCVYRHTHWAFLPKSSKYFMAYLILELGDKRISFFLCLGSLFSETQCDFSQVKISILLGSFTTHPPLQFFTLVFLKNKFLVATCLD